MQLFDLTYARSLDQADALAHLRQRFYTKPGQIYMDGNSLGLCSIDAEQAVLRALEDWKTHGIGLWTGADTNYFLYHDLIGEKLARLIGAQPDEVTVCASTTLNIHQCCATFWKPTKERYKILVDELNFPTDRYALVSQILQRGLDPATILVTVPSRDGKTLDEDALIAAMGEDVALVLLPSVLYRSAQLLDMARLTEEAHRRGCLIGFDLCHSIGSVDHNLDAIGCDFAVWCNYKYLSGGPGATAGLYIHRRHLSSSPGLWGWWGNRKDTQFELLPDFAPAANAGGWQTGTAPILSMAAIDGALNVYEGVDMRQVREKSLKLTGYLMALIDEVLAPYGFSVGNPREDAHRGGHVALEHEMAITINEALKAAGVVPDFRYPNVIRLAPSPMYTRFEDVYALVQILVDIMESKAYLKYDGASGPVT